MLLVYTDDSGPYVKNLSKKATTISMHPNNLLVIE